MPSVRNIREEAWIQMAQALRLYFSVRGEARDADDLVQRTFTTMLERDDYEFAQIENFRPVCYGFASKILQSHRREKARLPAPFPDDVTDTQERFDSARASEDRLFLWEVQRIAKEELSEDDWALVIKGAHAILDDVAYGFLPEEATRLRVRLHRLRKMLAKNLGWKRYGR